MKKFIVLLLATHSLPVYAQSSHIQALNAIATEWQAKESDLDAELRARRHHVWTCPKGQSCSSFRSMTDQEYLAALNKRDADKEAIRKAMRAKSAAHAAAICAVEKCKSVPAGKYGVEDLKGFINDHDPLRRK